MASWRTLNLIKDLGQSIGQNYKTKKAEEDEQGSRKFLAEKLGLNPVDKLAKDRIDDLGKTRNSEHAIPKQGMIESDEDYNKRLGSIAKQEKLIGDKTLKQDKDYKKALDTDSRYLSMLVPKPPTRHESLNKSTPKGRETRATIDSQIKKYQNAIKDAVADEDYTLAAEYRGRIKSLRKNLVTGKYLTDEQAVKAQKAGLESSSKEAKRTKLEEEYNNFYRSLPEEKRNSWARQEQWGSRAKPTLKQLQKIMGAVNSQYKLVGNKWIKK